MAVKHIPTSAVHKGQDGGTTACGFDTTIRPSHWVDSSETINCDKKGCKY